MFFSQAADETGRAILTTTATGATALTDARYGPRAASVAHDTGLTAVSAYRVVRFPSKFGATTIVKTFATTTADGARARNGGGGSGVAAAAAAGPADWQVGGLPGAPEGGTPVGGGGSLPGRGVRGQPGRPRLHAVRLHGGGGAGATGAAADAAAGGCGG